MSDKVEIEIVATDKASSVFRSVGSNLTRLGKGGISIAMTGMAALAGGFTLASGAMLSYMASATMTSARVDELRIVNDTLAEQLGYSNDVVRGYVEALRAQGIEAGFAEQALAKMMQANLDIAYSAELAAVAQGAAVIAGSNSSETYGRIIHGITTLNPLVLRHAGIVVDTATAYAEYADKIGIAASELTTAQKQTALMEAVTAQSAEMLQVYENAMKNPVKQLGSMKRLFNDLALNIGNNFLPGFSNLISALSEFIKRLITATGEGGSLEGVFQTLGTMFSDVVQNAGPALDTLFSFINLFGLLSESLLAGGTLTGIDLGDMFGGASTVNFTDIIAEIVAMFSDIAVSLAPTLVETAISIISVFSESILAALPLLIPVVSTLLQSIVIALIEGLPQILSAGVEIWMTLVSALFDAAPAILSSLGEFVLSMVSALTENLPRFMRIGVMLISEIATSLVAEMPRLIPTFVGVLKLLLQMIKMNAPILFEAATMIITSLIENLSTQLPLLLPLAIDVLDTIVQSLLENIAVLIPAALVLLTALSQAISDTLPVLMPVIVEIIGLIADILMANLPLITAVALDIIDTLMTGLIQSLPILMPVIVHVAMAMLETFVEQLPLFIEVGIEILRKIMLGVFEYLGEFLTVVPEIWDAMTAEMADWGPKLLNIGADIIAGIKQGIVNGLGSIYAIFEEIIDGAKNIFQQNSPSVVFRRISENNMAGMIVGAENMAPEVSQAYGNVLPQAQINTRALAYRTAAQPVEVHIHTRYNFADSVWAEREILPLIRRAICENRSVS